MDKQTSSEKDIMGYLILITKLQRELLLRKQIVLIRIVKFVIRKGKYVRLVMMTLFYKVVLVKANVAKDFTMKVEFVKLVLLINAVI